MSGWVKLHRQLSDHNLWNSEPFSKGQAWVDLLMLANHKDGFIIKRGIKIELKRGDVGWSEIELAKKWKWSRGKIRRFFDTLVELKMVQQIVQENKYVTSCIRIINYDTYQLDGTADGTAYGTADGTADGQQTDSKRYRNKNEKNEKNEKNTSFTLNDSDESNSEPKNTVIKIFFNFDTQEWENITEKDFIRWSKAYPACNIERQLAQMSDWLVANPKNKKANYSRFIANWLSNAQQKGGDIKANRAEQPRYTADMLPDF
jgi:hypothetical protein